MNEEIIEKQKKEIEELKEKIEIRELGNKSHINFLQEEFEKYMEEEKEKTGYSVSLTKENVEYIKGKIKVPFSKIVDDFIGAMSMAFKKMEAEKKSKEKLK